MAQSTNTQGEFEHLLEEAKQSEAIGDWRSSERQYNDARLLQPDNLTTLLSLAHSRRMLGKLVEARDTLSSALFHHPDDSELRLELGNIELDAKEYNAAAAIFDSLFARNLNLPAVWSGKLKCLLAMKQAETFDQAIEEALKAFANDPEVLTQCALIRFAQKQFATGIEMLFAARNRDQLLRCIRTATPESLPLLREVSERFPNNLTILRQLVETLVTLQQDRLAATIYQKIVELKPDDETSKENWFGCLRRLKSTNEARILAERMYQSNPKDRIARRHLADLHWQDGHEDDAVRLLKSPNEVVALLSKSPENRDHSKLLESALNKWPADIGLLLRSAGDYAKNDASYNKAEQTYRRVLKCTNTRPGDPVDASTQGERANTLGFDREARLELVRLLSHIKGRKGDAETEASAALEHHPNDLALLDEAATLAVGMGDLRRAADLWLRCSKYKEIASHSKILRDQGQFREALALLKYGLEGKADSLELLFAQGESYLDCREYEKALESYAAAVSLGKPAQTGKEPAGSSPDDQKRSPSSNDTDQKRNALYRLIYLLRATRQFEKADEILSTTVPIFERTDRDLTIQVERAWLEYSRNNYQSALSQFEALYENEGNDRSYIASGKALCLRKLTSRDEAIGFIDSVLSTELDQRGRLLVLKSQFCAEKGDLDAALSCCRAARELNELDGYLVEAALLSYLKRGDEAIILLEGAVNESTVATETLLIQAQLAWIAISDHDFLKAREIAEAIPDLGGAALKWGIFGSLCLAEQEYTHAADYFEKVLEAEPSQASAYCNLALALVRQEGENSPPAANPRFFRRAWLVPKTKETVESPEERDPRDTERLEKAKELCLEAIKIDTTYAQAHACLGEIEQKQKEPRLKEAEMHFRRSIKESAVDGDYVGLGALCLKTGQDREAEHMLKKACRLSPSDAQARIELSKLYIQAERSSEAIKILKEAVAIEPSSETAVRALGLAYLHKGDLSEAAKLLDKATKSFDEHKRWTLHLALGEVLSEMAEKMDDKELYSEALREVGNAVCLRKSPEVYFLAGVINFKLQDLAQAVKEFKWCLEVDPGHFEARLNLRRLTSILRERRSKEDFSGKLGIALACFSSLCLVVLWVLFIKQADTRISATMVTTLSPVLLGAAVVGFVLPYIVKFKMPGLEAELSRPKEQISAPPPSVSFGTTGVLALKR